MTSLKYAKPERLWLRDHPTLDERWLQDRIGEDPALLGLGGLILKDRERSQPGAGRLDLLLQDAVRGISHTRTPLDSSDFFQIWNAVQPTSRCFN